MFQPKKRIVVFDFETNGLDPVKCQPIEICAKAINLDGTMEVFHHMVRCPEKLPEKIIELTGITDDELEREGIDYMDAMGRLIHFIFNPWYSPDGFKEDMFLVGHNFIKFDIHFLKSGLQKLGNFMPQSWNGWDTAGHFKACRLFMGRRENESMLDMHLRALNTPVKGLYFKLGLCCQEAGIVLGELHRADADVEMTLQLFLHQFGIYSNQSDLLKNYVTHKISNSIKEGASVTESTSQHTTEAAHKGSENNDAKNNEGAGGNGVEQQPSNTEVVAEHATDDEPPGE